MTDKIIALRERDQDLLDALTPEQQQAVQRRMKVVAMAAGMHEALGSCKSYSEAQEKAAHYVYEDAVAPKQAPAPALAAA